MSVAARPERGDLHGEFLPSERGPLFVLLHSALGDSRNCVLVVPPFAEEMNKSRRLVTEVAGALTARGVAVAIPDLFGTGDSAGDFGDATWATWLGDLARCREWVEARGLTVSGLLAIRLGAALASDALTAGKLSPVQRTTLCQPVFDCKRHLQQFLRLRLAANLMSKDSGETIDKVRGALSSGATVEVAGYALSPTLAQELERAVPMEQLPHEFGEVDWIEVVREADAPISAQAIRFSERGGARGAVVRTHTVVGEPFWAATESVVDRKLFAMLNECLSGNSFPVGNPSS